MVARAQTVYMEHGRLVTESGSPVQRRRTDFILDAIKKELEARRDSLNADAPVRSVTVIVKLKQGTPHPRAVILTVETETEL